MANSDLYGKIIGRIPVPVLDYMKKYIENNKGLENLEGYQHAKSLISNPEISYSLAKKIKHFFDSYSSLKDDRNSFELHGGIRMKKYIEHLLDNVRSSVTRGKQVKGLAFGNQFRATHTKSFDRPQQIGNLTNFSNNKQKNYISESEMKELKSAAIGFIFNDKQEVLLLQRAKDDDWMPMKWATLGGGIEAGEQPEETLVREAMEEAHANITNVKFMYEKIEDDTKVYVFKGLCDNPGDIKIDLEHEKFKWVAVEDVHKFNLVPDLLKDLNKIIEDGN